MDASNASKVTQGLFQKPMCIPSNCMWASERGQVLFRERQKTMSFYQIEEVEMRSIMKQIAPTLPDKVAIFDLGAGLTSKTTTLFESIFLQKPNIQICHVPMDIADCVNDWESHLKENFPSWLENIVHIKPVVGDILDIDLNGVLEGTEYAEWSKFFVMFGPNSTFLLFDDFQNLMKLVGNQLKGGGEGFLFSYIPGRDNVAECFDNEFFDQIDLKTYLKCFMEGFCKLSGVAIDPDWFDYEKEYLKNLTRDGVKGNFTGIVLNARAKQDIEFQCEGKVVSLKKGEVIRMSEEVAQCRLYSPEYMESLTGMYDLKLKRSTFDSGNLLTLNFYTSENGCASEAIQNGYGDQ